MSIEKDNWWYYFDKIENGKYAKCKNCDWQKDRGIHKSSNILKNHLENSYPYLYQQKLSTVQEKHEKERKRKLSLNSFRNTIAWVGAQKIVLLPSGNKAFFPQPGIQRNKVSANYRNL